MNEPMNDRIAESVALSYRINFNITAALHQAEHEAVVSIYGKIVHVDDHAIESDAGALEGWCVRISRAACDEYNLCEAFDSCDELDEVAAHVWDLNKEAYCKDLKLKAPKGDLIVPWSIALLPEHRGKGIGLLALWRFLDYFGSEASLAVVKPYPLNHNPDIRELWNQSKMQYDRFANVPLDEGKAKLAAHWSRLGFRQIRDSDLFFLDMVDRLSFDDLIDGIEWST